MWSVWPLTCRPRILLPAVVSALLLVSHVTAFYSLDVNSEASIRDVAKRMAQDLVSLYTGDKPGQTPGLLPQPYYWWEGGSFLGVLIDYWYYTGDTTYNNLVTEGLLFQVGPNNDYMPPNQTLTEGNDDQGFWGMAVMSAAEHNFPDPPAGRPQWLSLAQAVFNTQAARWDTRYCNGGLRWQIFQWNNGWNYKNSISQACFFNIAARLALYTGNSTYADWAVKTWDWMRAVKFMDDSYYIYDGAHIDDNCTKIVPYQFSYNAGAFLLGAAAMHQLAEVQNKPNEQAMWRQRVDGLLAGMHVFVYNESSERNILHEVACESVNLCDVDQQSFKAYLSRWMAATTKWATWTYSRIKPILENSAVAAAKQCTGGANGRMCGLRWANNSGKWDGTSGVGQQMAALEVVLANMIKQAPAPVTNHSGGTSVGDPNAGGADIGRIQPQKTYELKAITRSDRAGAVALTIAMLAVFLVVLIFLVADETATREENWDRLRSPFTREGILAACVRRCDDDQGQSDVRANGKAQMDASSMEGEEKALPRYVSLPEPAGVRHSRNNRSLSSMILSADTSASFLTVPTRRESMLSKRQINTSSSA